MFATIGRGSRRALPSANAALIGRARNLKMAIAPPPPGFTEVIFIECGTGTDQHGQEERDDDVFLDQILELACQERSQA